MFSWSVVSGYEVSTAGDRRFSALFATMPDGRTIEMHYQCDIKGFDLGGRNWRLGKGKRPIRRIELWPAYLGLWRTWAAHHPHLLAELLATLQHDGEPILRDRFARTEVNQAHALSELLNEKILFDE